MVRKPAVPPGIPANPTMRDIHDYCVSNKLPSLAQGMIELPPPAKLRQIACDTVMRDEVHQYRNRMGVPEYREAIAKLVNIEYNETEVNAECVLATHGVSGGLVATFAMLRARHPQKVIRVGLLEPFYTYHKFQMERIFGEKKEIVPIAAHGPLFDAPLAAIQAALNAPGGLDIIILTLPNNPTGRVWTKGELSELLSMMDRCEPKPILLCDECYSDLVFVGGGESVSPNQMGLRDNVVVCRGFSKILGCQSWRVGYTISTEKTVKELMVVADPIYICVPFLQHAMADYLAQDNLEDFKRHKAKCSGLIRKNWGILSGAFAKAFGWKPIEPQGTMYGMFIHNDDSDMAACIRALNLGVGICPGSMFMWDQRPNTGYVRIHMGVTEEKARSIAEGIVARAEKERGRPLSNSPSPAKRPRTMSPTAKSPARR